MNVALIGLGYLGYAVLQRLLEIGTQHVVVVAASTPHTQTALDGLRALYPGVEITQHAAFSRAVLDPTIEACILASDSAEAEDHFLINEAAVHAGVALIPAVGMGDVVHVGPRIDGGPGPCLRCIDTRVQASRGQNALVGPYPANPELLAQAGRLACDYLHAGDVALDAVTYVWSHGAQTQSQALRVRTCPTCALHEPLPAFARPGELDLAGGLPADKARIRELEPMIVDPVMGTVRTVTNYQAAPTEPQVAHAVASIADPIWAQYGQELNGGGNDLSLDTAHAAALGEALDRVATTQPVTEHLVVAPFTELQDHAIDPTRFDMFDKRTLDLPGFP